MKRGVTVIILLFVLAGALALLAMRQPLALRVRVVDPAGNPVRGAIIQPDGIRGTDRAHYGWGDGMAVKPLAVTTDADGRATIPYPKYVLERVRSIELSFGLAHPGFAADRPFIAVASPITSATPLRLRAQYMLEDFRRRAKTEVITMKLAGVVEVTARLNGELLAATNFHAQLAPEEGSFEANFIRDGPRLISKQIPPGKFLVRAVHLAPDGTRFFSVPDRGLASAGETNKFQFDLSPGISVKGKLTGVEGTIENGWVNARVIYGPGTSEVIEWADYVPVAADGQFVLTGLPPGRLELVAVCDGHLSRKPASATGGLDVYPQMVEIPADHDLEVPMQPASVARIRVITPDEKPLAGAVVVFWPNVQWANRWSTVFASDHCRTAEALQAGDAKRGPDRRSMRDFQAKTDTNGIAVVPELPPGRANFAVLHELYCLPLNADNGRSEAIRLIANETSYTAVKLVKKGEQPRE